MSNDADPRENLRQILLEQMQGLQQLKNSGLPSNQLLSSMVAFSQDGMARLQAAIPPMSLERVEELREDARKRYSPEHFAIWEREMYPQFLRGRAPLHMRPKLVLVKGARSTLVEGVPWLSKHFHVSTLLDSDITLNPPEPATSVLLVDLLGCEVTPQEILDFYKATLAKPLLPVLLVDWPGLSDPEQFPGWLQLAKPITEEGVGKLRESLDQYG